MSKSEAKAAKQTVQAKATTANSPTSSWQLGSTSKSKKVNDLSLPASEHGTIQEPLVTQADATCHDSVAVNSEISMPSETRATLVQMGPQSKIIVNESNSPDQTIPFEGMLPKIATPAREDVVSGSSEDIIATSDSSDAKLAMLLPVTKVRQSARLKERENADLPVTDKMAAPKHLSRGWSKKADKVQYRFIGKEEWKLAKKVWKAEQLAKGVSSMFLYINLKLTVL